MLRLVRRTIRFLGRRSKKEKKKKKMKERTRSEAENAPLRSGAKSCALGICVRLACEQAI